MDINSLTFLRQRYTGYIIGGFVLVIFITVLVTAWHNNADISRNKIGDVFFNTVSESGRMSKDGMLKKLKQIADDDNTGFSQLAHMKLAVLSFEEGNHESIADHYTALVTNNNTHPIIREIAAYNMGMIMINENKPNMVEEYITVIKKSGNDALADILNMFGKMRFGTAAEASGALKEIMRDPGVNRQTKEFAKKMLKIYDANIKTDDKAK